MDVELLLIVAAASIVLTGAVCWLAWRWSRAETRDLLQRIARLPLRAMLRLAWTLLQDKRVPLAGRAILPGLFLYLALPVDIVPDFIPVLGQLDDVVIALAAVGLFLRSTPPGLIEAHLSHLEAAAATRRS